MNNKQMKNDKLTMKEILVETIIGIVFIAGLAITFVLLLAVGE